MNDDTQLIHDRKCATCEKMLDCKGMPEGTKNCISYVERKRNEDGGRKPWMWARYF